MALTEKEACSKERVLFNIGHAIGDAQNVLGDENRSVIYQVVLGHIPQEEIDKFNMNRVVQRMAQKHFVDKAE